MHDYTKPPPMPRDEAIVAVGFLVLGLLGWIATIALIIWFFASDPARAAAGDHPDHGSYVSVGGGMRVYVGPGIDDPDSRLPSLDTLSANPNDYADDCHGCYGRGAWDWARDPGWGTDVGGGYSGYMHDRLVSSSANAPGGMSDGGSMGGHL